MCVPALCNSCGLLKTVYGDSPAFSLNTVGNRDKRGGRASATAHKIESHRQKMAHSGALQNIVST